MATNQLLLLIPAAAAAGFQHSPPNLPHSVLQPQLPQLEVQRLVNQRLVNLRLVNLLPPYLLLLLQHLSSGIRIQHRRLQHLFLERLLLSVFFPSNNNNQVNSSNSNSRQHPSGQHLKIILIHSEPILIPPLLSLIQHSALLLLLLLLLPRLNPLHLPNLLAQNRFTNLVQRPMINKFHLIIKNRYLNRLFRHLRVKILSGEKFQSGYHLLKLGKRGETVYS